MRSAHLLMGSGIWSGGKWGWLVGGRSKLLGEFESLLAAG